MSLKQLIQNVTDRMVEKLDTIPTHEELTAASRKEESDAAHRRWELGRRARELGVPADDRILAVCAGENPPETQALCAVRELLRWREAQRRTFTVAGSILLAGPAGVGKTVAAARVVTRHPRSARFTTADEILATPRNGYSTNEEAWAEWLAVDLLAIDDLGTEAGDSTALTRLWTKRIDAGLATVLTSNLEEAAILARYIDHRVGDRLLNGQKRAGGPSWFCPLAGKSLRNPETLAKLTGGAK